MSDIVLFLGVAVVSTFVVIGLMYLVWPNRFDSENTDKEN